MDPNEPSQIPMATDVTQETKAGENASLPTESVTGEHTDIPDNSGVTDNSYLAGSTTVTENSFGPETGVTGSANLQGSEGVPENTLVTGGTGATESQGGIGSAVVTGSTDVTGSTGVSGNTLEAGITGATESAGVAGSTEVTGSAVVTTGGTASEMGQSNTDGTDSTSVTGSTDVTSTSVTGSTDVTSTTVTSGSTVANSETTWTFDESEFADLSESDDLGRGLDEKEFDVEWNSRRFLLPSYILSLEKERHLRAEDPHWALRPVPLLERTIIRASMFRKGPELPSLLKHLNPTQREIVIKFLPLDIPLQYTLPLNDFESYWKRKCTDKWKHCPVWRYNDEWKTLFVERTVQESIENFVPEESDLFDFKATLVVFKNYARRLKISRLAQRRIDPLVVDVADEDFEVVLDNFLGFPDSTSVFLDFETVLGTLSELREFFFVLTPSSLDSSLRLSTKDFNSLFRGLKKCARLEKLRFANGILTLRQKQLVLNSLCAHAHLRELNLSYDAVSDVLCDHIGKLLLSQCPLKSLVLKDNRITDEGAEVLASALSVNQKLELLDLSANWIQNSGGIALAKVLATNPSLQTVDVSENKLTAPAGAAFADALCHSGSIRCFRINENNLGEDVGPHFSRAVVENNGLLTLEVKDCLFSPIDENIIHKTLLKNRSRVPFDMYA